MAGVRNFSPYKMEFLKNQDALGLIRYQNLFKRKGKKPNSSHMQNKISNRNYFNCVFILNGMKIYYVDLARL